VKTTGFPTERSWIPLTWMLCNSFSCPISVSPYYLPMFYKGKL
jgi:hypothetical protein